MAMGRFGSHGVSAWDKAAKSDRIAETIMKYCLQDDRPGIFFLLNRF